MNVQLFSVKTNDRDGVIRCIGERLESQPDIPGKQPDWGLPSSYDTWLAKEPKRKVAVSRIWERWVAAVESKQVLDFAMLQDISERLGVELVACQLADVVDSCGYACCQSGQLLEKKWVENDLDPLGTLRAYLRRRSIPYDLLTFREAAQLLSEGWEIIHGWTTASGRCSR